MVPQCLMAFFSLNHIDMVAEKNIYDYIINLLSDSIIIYAFPLIKLNSKCVCHYQYSGGLLLDRNLKLLAVGACCLGGLPIEDLPLINHC